MYFDKGINKAGDADKEILSCKNHEEVLVEILVLTYNHENYIGQALDSVLMQRTEYPYKIIIGADCSTDNTQQIVIDYYKKYPDKIEVLLWRERVGAVANDIGIVKRCKAKYVAYLEGDDYWTTPYKLQKQVSFLEKHPEYIGTAHNVRCVDEEGALLHRDFNFYPIVDEHVCGRIQAEQLKKISQTASLVYKNVYKQWDRTQWDFYRECNVNGDEVLQVFLGMQGPVYFFREIMADHRRVFHGESWTAYSTGKNMLVYHYQSRKLMQGYLQKYYNTTFVNDDGWKSLWEESKKILLCNFNMQNLKVCCGLLLEKWMRSGYGFGKHF